MKSLLLLIAIFVFVTSTKQSLAQQKQIDSLKVLIAKSNNDSLKIEFYKKICIACPMQENLKFGNEALKFTENVEVKKSKNISLKYLLTSKAYFTEIIKGYYIDKKDYSGELSIIDKQIQLYQQIGDTAATENTFIEKYFLYEEMNNSEKGFDVLLVRLKLYEKQNNLRFMAYYQKEIAAFYKNHNDYDKAYSYMKQSLKFYQSNNNKTYNLYASAICLRDIGQYYEFKELNDSALVYYKRAIKIIQSLKNKIGKDDYMQFFPYTQVGSTYIKINQYDSAFTYYDKAKKYALEINDTSVLKNVYRFYAIALAETKQVKKAIEYTNKALVLAKASKDIKSEMRAYAEIARFCLQDKNTREALQYADKSEKMADSVDDKDQLQQLYYLKYKIFDTQHDYKNALQYHIKLEAIKDTLELRYNSEEIEKKTMIADFEKNEAIKQEEQSKKDAIDVEEKKKQRIILFSVFGALCLLTILAIVVFRNLRQSKKTNKIIEQQKHLVEEKHKEITDSINYAERIQRSFLATEKQLNENLNNYFVLFKPKDVVSGDFYWSAKLNNGNFALATADSTGHGVPGAIMSLLNVTSLEKAIEHHINPADILNHTRQTIIERLKKDGSEEGGKDGMDCSLLVFDFTNKQLLIAAANNPVWIIRSNPSNEGARQLAGGDVELIEIKPDKMPVGKNDKQDQSFTTHTVELQKGDTIYTLTDGFPDQFGGDKGKKFMSKKLKELLLANVHLPIAQQKELLDSTFKNWVGNLEQVDDVTVIGIKV
jgi:serine phosphatase RsbU (regulator of sigma subunit)